MRNELKSTLLKWRNDENKIGIRKINFRLFPEFNNEYVITLSEELNITINQNTKNVLVKKTFRTFAQENNQNNPLGDIYRAEQNIEKIVAEFNNKNEEAINELLSDYLGDFDELN